MNDEFHVTPTSGVLDVLRNMRSTFSHDITWKTQNRLELVDNFKLGMRGFLEGFFNDKGIVFDKCRGWTNNIALLDEVLGHKETKILFCYRDPVEVVSSIEAQYQKTLILENTDEQQAPGAFLTLDRRVGTFINDGGIISYPVEILRDAIEMGYENRIMIVRYYDLTNFPQATMDKIHDFLGEPRNTYDINNLKQSTFEHDGFYNYKFLHTIKEGAIKYKQADVILPPRYVNIVNNRFAGLNKYVFEGNPDVLLGLV
jgi:sulfotransferase